jgi:hypothetical protein
MRTTAGETKADTKRCRQLIGKEKQKQEQKHSSNE